MFPSLDMPCITKFSEGELSLLEKLVTISSDVNTEKVIVLPVLQLFNIIIPLSILHCA